MAKYLIDVNLPKRFRLWSSDEFLRVVDLNREWSDTRIWQFAEEHKLSIISKDADFAAKIIAANPPPKIIHLKIGNMQLNELHEFISRNWSEITNLNETHKLVNVYEDRITATA